MKTTHRWLASLCPHGLAPEAVADLLRSLGHEVAGLEPLPDGDTLIALEITANRPDCLSVLGLAHEISAATGVPVRLPEGTDGEPGKGPEVAVADPRDCPLYTARRILGVAVGPSPAWLARRLEAIGLKPLCNVVDVTNYVLYELGQPLHAFDAARLQGGLRVRRALPGERLRTLDGVERTLSPEVLVIADAGGAVAVAGVMGGAGTAVTGATRDVLIESAAFDPALVRRTSRALALASDSSYRFERGVDPHGVTAAGARAARLLAETGGGSAGTAASAGEPPAAPRPFRLRRARLTAVLGFAVPHAETERILKGLGCALRADGDAWQVTPPTRRARDLRTEAEAAEEVARVWGYDRIPGRIALPARPGEPDPAQGLADALSERLRAAGFSEAVTTSFVDAGAAALRLDRPAPPGPALALANPMTSDQTHLRQSLLPGLLAALAHNQSVGEPGGRLFEMGRVYGRDGESWRLALAAEADLRDVKGALASALGALGLDLEAAPGEAGAAFAPARAVLLGAGGETLGAAGAASPDFAGAHGLRRPPVVAELALEPLLRLSARGQRRFRPLPRFPAVDRDLAVVVDEGVAWSRIEAAALSVPCPFRERLAFFDLYRGSQAGPGRKSVAFSIRFRHPDRTLTGGEVDAVMASTIAALERDCAAQVRR